MMRIARRRRSVAAPGAATAPSRPDDVDRLSLDSESQQRALEVLRPAIAATHEQPLQIDIEMREKTAVKTVQARVDVRSRVLEGSMLLSQRRQDSALVSHVVANGTVHVSNSALGEPTRTRREEAADGLSGGPLLQQVFTGYGRIEGTLTRIVRLLSSVPFASKVVDCGGSAYEVMVMVSPWAIYGFYLDSGLEVVRPTMATNLTRLGFRIEQGLLRGLVAEGPHFGNGVARELSATAVYTPTAPFTPVLPEADAIPQVAMSG